MTQFVAYRNERASQVRIPYLLDVQSDLVQTGSRLVIPLVRKADYGPRYSRFNPLLRIEGDEVVAACSDLVAVDERLLRSAVVDLSSYRHDILAAIDFLLTGY